MGKGEKPLGAVAPSETLAAQVERQVNQALRETPEP
jgi:hypothetical protein